MRIQPIKRLHKTRNDDGGGNMKALVLYYSFEGNTHSVAKKISEHLGADIQHIEPIKELKTKGFYKYVWGGRQAVMKTKPAIKSIDKNPEDYDLIVIGTPVWASTFTPPIRSYLDQSTFKGKKIAFFYCHMGGAGKTVEHFDEAMSENQIIARQEFVNPLTTDEMLVMSNVKNFVETIESNYESR